MTDEQILYKIIHILNLTKEYIQRTVEEKGYKSIDDIEEQPLKDIVEQISILDIFWKEENSIDENLPMN